MTESPTPFDHRPDPVLGAALARALDPADPDTRAFVARVLARAETARAAPPTWEVLAGWAGRGIAAAALAALLVGLAVVQSSREPVGVEEAFTPSVESEATTALLSGTRPPDPSVVFATLGER